MDQKNMVSTDLTKIEELSGQVISTCSKGFIKKYNTAVPDVTIQSYNNVIRIAGGIVGWSDKEKFVIDPDKVVKNLTICIDLYDEAINNLRQHNYSDDVLKTFSPVLIVSSLLERHKKELILSLSHTHIFATIALLELSNFRLGCENFIGEYGEGVSEKELLNLVTAQSRLSIAQEAINKALEVAYEAKDVVRDKISTVDEITLKLQLETALYQNRKGGKTPPPHYRNNSTEIGNLIQRLENKEIKNAVFKAEIFKLTKAIPDPKTIKKWRENYRNNGYIY